jgi:hypothetical protein
VVNAEDPSEVFIENTPATPLFVPLGLASDGDTLYVGDWATGIVWAISDAGTAPLASALRIDVRRRGRAGQLDLRVRRRRQHGLPVPQTRLISDRDPAGRMSAGALDVRGARSPIGRPCPERGEGHSEEPPDPGATRYAANVGVTVLTRIHETIAILVDLP